jgi:hypothetical protein
VLLISRIILPITYQPDLTSTGGGSSGFGDANPTFFFSPAKPGKLQARVQLAFLFPAGGSKSKPPEKESSDAGASALLTPAAVSPPRTRPPGN